MMYKSSFVSLFLLFFLYLFLFCCHLDFWSLFMQLSAGKFCCTYKWCKEQNENDTHLALSMNKVSDDVNIAIKMAFQRLQSAVIE